VNINRHNYEEFFLLYVDGELSQADREAVKVFVQQNPDLQQELEMLQQAVLAPEDVTFTNKELLLQHAEAINTNNYETYFLLAVDDELREDEKADLERFVLQHPQLQDEFTLLQATRLPNETIHHPNKYELYRNEKVRRIVPLWMSRMSAAAVVILVAGAWWLLRNQNEIADAEGGNLVRSEVVTAPATSKPVTDAVIASNDVNAGQPAENKTSEVVNSKTKQAPLVSYAAAGKPRRVERENVQLQETPKQKLLPPTPEMVAALIKPGEQPKSGLVVNANNSSVVTSNAIAANNDKVNEQDPIISQAVYKDMNTDEEDNTLLIGTVAFNKNKLKSIFGKATGLFKRKAERGDEETPIQIASFQIKSK